MTAQQWLTLAWTAIVILALAAGYMLGWLRGNKVCNEWWNQYGAQIFAERGAVIYGTALYKQPSPPGDGEKVG